METAARVEKLRVSLLLVAACLLLTACGRGEHRLDADAPNLSVSASARRASLSELIEDCKVRLMPQALTEDAMDGSPTVELRWDAVGALDGEVTASICSTASLELKALLLEIEYPAELLLPELTGQGEFAADGALNFRAGVAGRVQFAAVIPGAKPQKLSAGNVLARISFSLNSGAVAQRVVSAANPPLTSASRTSLSFDEAQGTFIWSYRNSGDYDQNGEVNAADMVPLGQNFGAQPLSTAARLADGNGDGQVNLGDITAIGANFGARIEGYRLYTSDSGSDYPLDGLGPNGPGAELLGSVALASAEPRSLDDPRLSFSYTPEGHSFSKFRVYWLRPYVGDAEGVASSTVGSVEMKDGFTVELVASFTNKLALDHGAVFGEIDHTVVSATAETRVNVYLRGASAVRALDAKIRFDPERYSPVELLAGPHLMNAGDYRLQAGRSTAAVDCSAFLRDPSFGNGMNGDVLVYTVRFAHKPQADGQEFLVPKRLVEDMLPLELHWNSDSSSLEWLYHLTMDGYQNSDVSISDLTVIGQLLNQSANDSASLAYLVDGNRNGVVESWDALWLGAFFQWRVDGYVVFRSKDAETYPSAAGAEQLSKVLFGDINSWEQDPPMRLRFSKQLELEDRGYFYWLQPYNNDSNKGNQIFAPSNLVYVP